MRACWKSVVWQTVEILLIKQMQVQHGKFCVNGRQMLLSPRGHPWALWEQGIKQEGKRKINEWKPRAGPGTSSPQQSACGHRCIPSAQIECDLCVRRRPSSPLCVSTGERAAPLRNPVPRWKHFPPCIMRTKIIRALCNQKRHKARNTRMHKETAMLFGARHGPQSQMQGTWWKPEAHCERSLNKALARCFPARHPRPRWMWKCCSF